MDAQELLQELVEFLNVSGNYQDFLNYMEQRGFDVDELEADIESATE